MNKRALFVCIENSCRSQMAEAFARKWGKGAIEAHSAGSRPSGKVNERAVAFMKEKGIDLGAQQSKGLTDLPAGRWDYIVTMGCGDACPSLPANERLDWNLPDPKNLPDDEFRKVRDDIEARVKSLIDKVEGGIMKIEVFEPAMCCSTGVCGPSVDPVLPKFAADVEWLKSQGVAIERFNLSQQPAPFAANATVKEEIAKRGVECLPLFLVNGRIASWGAYPAREQLAKWAGLKAGAPAKTLSVKKDSSDDCCGPKGCC